MIDAIQKILETNGRCIVAIDGRCGGGKTTLAEKMRDQFGCTVIHMDDFFLPPDLRTSERLATPGENVHHERFLQEVLIPLRNGSAFSFRPFDCGAGDFGDPISITPGALTVVEGSYCCHPKLRSYYDLTVFVDIDPETQMSRIVRRNSLTAEIFRNKWIPLEEKYFVHYRVKENSDIIIRRE